MLENQPSEGSFSGTTMILQEWEMIWKMNSMSEIISCSMVVPVSIGYLPVSRPSSWSAWTERLIRKDTKQPSENWSGSF